MFKKLFRPALATLSILAVGAAAAVVGANFAGPAPAVAPSSADVPVLQPIGYGDRAPQLDSDGDPLTGAVSPIQGFRTMPLGADGLPDPGRGFMDAVGDLTESEAPDASDFSFDIVEGDGHGDDACAPEGDVEVEGCPDGIRGAVFAVVAPDDLWVRAGKPHAPSPEMPAYARQCEPVDHPATSLPYGFISNAPGSVSMRYWPRGDEAAAVSVEASTPEADALAWEAALAANDTFEGDWIYNNTCLVLDGLEPYVGYVFEYTFTDILDRTFTKGAGENFGFRLPEDRTAPPTQIQPVGRNAVFLSAPHTEDVDVRFNVQVVDEGETADCTLTGDRLPLVDDARISTTVEVSPDFLADNGYLPRYTQRTSTTVFVPEGSTIVACVAEFDDDRPGWKWLDAQRHTWRILQTPDSARPLVSVDDVTLFGDIEADAVSMAVRWPNNQGNCGLWRGPDAAGDEVGDSELGSLCGDEEHPITQDDATVYVTVNHDGETVNSTFVLPLSSLACTGACATPPTTWFSVPLSIEGTPVEMCGSGMRAPCDPADARGAVGTASIKVDWADGSRNGLAEWQVSEESRADVEHGLAPLPQMDWLVTPEVTVHESSRSASIRFELDVDRPVTYTATATTESGCERPGAQLTVTGEAVDSRSTVVTLHGACLGMQYRPSVTLVDADGNTSVFGMVAGSTHPWPDASSVFTPRIDVDDLALWYDVELPQDAAQMKILQLRVVVDGQEIDPQFPEDNCVRGTRFGHPAGGPFLRDAMVAEEVPIEITLQLAVAYGGTDAERAYCDAGWDDAPVYTLNADLNVEDLLGVVELTLPDDAPYEGTFTLHHVASAP